MVRSEAASTSAEAAAALAAAAPAPATAGNERRYASILALVNLFFFVTIFVYSRLHLCFVLPVHFLIFERIFS